MSFTFKNNFLETTSLTKVVKRELSTVVLRNNEYPLESVLLLAWWRKFKNIYLSNGTLCAELDLRHLFLPAIFVMM